MSIPSIHAPIRTTALGNDFRINEVESEHGGSKFVFFSCPPMGVAEPFAIFEITTKGGKLDLKRSGAGQESRAQANIHLEHRWTTKDGNEMEVKVTNYNYRDWRFWDPMSICIKLTEGSGLAVSYGSQRAEMPGLLRVAV